MTGSRNFFRKGVEAKKVADNKPLPKPKPVHKGLVQIETKEGRVLLMGSAQAAMQQGRSKGGREAHRKGTRFCWTSEQARAAAQKAWKTRWRKAKGIRIGRPAKQRPAVNHAKLRTYYSTRSYMGVQFDAKTNVWMQTDSHNKVTYPITERTALIRLGHLPPPRKRGLVPVGDGIPIATKRKHKEGQ